MGWDDIIENIQENKKTFLIVLGVVVVCIIIAILNFMLGKQDRQTDVKKLVESFGKTYYEEKYYPDLIIQYPKDFKTELQTKQTSGITITLRTIVGTFENLDAKNFYKKGRYCDFVETYATIYPKAPYGQKDYKIEVNVSCTKKLNK